MVRLRLNIKVTRSRSRSQEQKTESVYPVRGQSLGRPPRIPRPGWKGGAHVGERAPYGSACEKGHTEAKGPHTGKAVHEGEGSHRSKL